MSKFNFNKLGDDIMRDAKNKIEQDVTNKIKKTFPEITNFSVNYDVKSQKVTIIGLTEDQVKRLD